MGTSPINPPIFPLQNQHWTILKGYQNQVKCQETGIMGQYRVVGELSQQDIRCLQLRATHSHLLVNVLALYSPEQIRKHIEQASSILPVQGQYLLILEHVRYRLVDLGPLSFLDGVYLLLQGIKAIRVLAKHFDNFSIPEEAIGITEHGQCKFWISPDYFHNTPYSVPLPPPSSSFCSSQSPPPSLPHTMHSFITQIQKRLQPTLSKQDHRLYQLCKSKFLGKGDGDEYQIEKVEMWVEGLVREVGISDGYRMLGGGDQLEENTDGNCKSFDYLDINKTSLRRTTSGEIIQPSTPKFQTTPSTASKTAQTHNPNILTPNPKKRSLRRQLNPTSSSASTSPVHPFLALNSYQKASVSEKESRSTREGRSFSMWGNLGYDDEIIGDGIEIRNSYKGRVLSSYYPSIGEQQSPNTNPTNPNPKFPQTSPPPKKYHPHPHKSSTTQKSISPQPLKKYLQSRQSRKLPLHPRNLGIRLF